MTPYFKDGTVTLYLGDCREVLPQLDVTVDAIVTDPPYGETSLEWDRWVTDWPALAATAAHSMWCFGSMRMFLEHGHEFTAAGWKFSQDIVWEKANGTSFATDRFKRVHEAITHWYTGDWRNIYHDTPKSVYTGASKNARIRRDDRAAHTGSIKPVTYHDDGTRLMRSVLQAQSVRGGLHPTEKPIGILDPLIRYACPPGGLVLDLFAGSGSTLDAARQADRRAVGIEANEKYAEAAAKRLSQSVLDFETAPAVTA
jgi:site-specific DNA-methyltransferase (adenine-specific)